MKLQLSTVRHGLGLFGLSLDLGDVYALSGELRNARQAGTDYTSSMLAIS